MYNIREKFHLRSQVKLIFTAATFTKVTTDNQQHEKILYTEFH